MKNFLILFITLVSPQLFAQVIEPFKYIKPEVYNCVYTEKEPKIDGLIDEDEWAKASWTNNFVDIEGRNIKVPYKNTRAKIMWNENYLFFAFELEEDHIWAKLKNRDDIIFYDNDIEIFLDIDSDTHNYVEYELNAFNTLWDLYLAKPYREGGPILHEWDHKGVKTAVKINGSLNNPKDEDKSWTVEFALPWKGIIELNSPKKIPGLGEEMRINFSRVQWETKDVNGVYKKKKDKSGKVLAENNWVWSPIGAIDMHRPEYWGAVFLTKDDKKFDIDENEEILKQILFHLYKAEKTHLLKNKNICLNLKELGVDEKLLEKYHIEIQNINNTFELIGKSNDSNFFKVNSQGKLTTIKN